MGREKKSWTWDLAGGARHQVGGGHEVKMQKMKTNGRDENGG